MKRIRQMRRKLLWIRKKSQKDLRNQAPWSSQDEIITKILENKESLRGDEELIQMPRFRLEVTWTESQKKRALELFQTMMVHETDHYFDGRTPYETLCAWRKNGRFQRKVGAGRKIKSQEFENRIMQWFLDAGWACQRGRRISRASSVKTAGWKNLRREII